MAICVVCGEDIEDTSEMIRIEGEYYHHDCWSMEDESSGEAT